MHRRSSVPEPLSFIVAPAPLQVPLQPGANKAAGLMEPGLLILGAKIQCLLYLPRRRSLDVAKDDHLPQGWRHLSDGLARLFQGASAVDGNAKGVPGGGRVRPVARPFRILWGDEPIDREHGLPLLCRSWNDGH